MKLYIAKNVLGAFAFDGNGKLVDKELFPRTADEIVRKLNVAEVTAEEEALSKRLGGEIIFERDAPNIGGEILRSELDGILSTAGCTRNEYQKLLREVSFALARLGVRRFAEEKDRLAIQAAAALEDINEAANLLAERLREWYSLHFPELSMLVEEHKKYAQLIRSGAREKITGDEVIEKAARASIGAELREKDANAVAGLAKRLHELYELREELSNYTSSLMDEIAPNLSALAGHLLGAKLIALSGGLENLARMPASRIQILGAAKARFSSKRTPKYGAIFQHPMIKGAPWWHRGKISRSFAAKIAIAARVDAGSKQPVAEKLKQELEKRIEAIKKSYPSEPKRMRIIRSEPEKKKWRKKTNAASRLGRSLQRVKAKRQNEW